MNMSVKFIGGLLASALSGGATADVIMGVSAVQDADTRLVTVTYTLSETAVVTPEITVGGAVDASVPVTAVNGEINRKLSAGTHSFTWRPRADWPTGRSLADAEIAVRAWPLDAPPDYLVADLRTTGAVRYYATAAAIPSGLQGAGTQGGLVLRRIRATGRRYRMGSPGEEAGRVALREIPHYVTLTNDFYIGLWPVTCEQHFYVTNEPGTAPNSDCISRPKLGLGFADMRGSGSDYDWPDRGHDVSDGSFFGRLRTRTGVKTFDLPTEAEWEFACRAGTDTPLYDEGPATALAWYLDSDFSANGGDGDKDKAQHCGLLRPNAWGLHDMLGDCYEFCLDWYSEGSDFATSGMEVTAPVGPASNANGKKVTRGGCYKNDASVIRCAFRGYDNASGYSLTGFRVAGRADVSNGQPTFAAEEAQGASLAGFDLSAGGEVAATLTPFDSLVRFTAVSSGMNFKSTEPTGAVVIFR